MEPLDFRPPLILHSCGCTVCGSCLIEIIDEKNAAEEEKIAMMSPEEAAGYEREAMFVPHNNPFKQHPSTPLIVKWCKLAADKIREINPDIIVSDYMCVAGGTVADEKKIPCVVNFPGLITFG